MFRIEGVGEDVLDGVLRGCVCVSKVLHCSALWSAVFVGHLGHGLALVVEIRNQPRGGVNVQL